MITKNKKVNTFFILSGVINSNPNAMTELERHQHRISFTLHVLKTCFNIYSKINSTLPAILEKISRTK